MRLFLVAKRELPRTFPLFRDPAVPAWAKVLAVLAAVLIVSPLNLLSDIPLLGFFDDAVMLAFVLHAFVRLRGCAEHEESGTGQGGRFERSRFALNESPAEIE